MQRNRLRGPAAPPGRDWNAGGRARRMAFSRARAFIMQTHPNRPVPHGRRARDRDRGVPVLFISF